jgi:phage terminase large subunit
LKRKGYPRIRPSIKGPNSVQEGVEFLRSFEIIIDPSCIHTAEEIKDYSFKVDPLTDEVLPILEDKKNHTIDSLRYAIERHRRAKLGLI